MRMHTVRAGQLAAIPHICLSSNRWDADNVPTAAGVLLLAEQVLHNRMRLRHVQTSSGPCLDVG